MLPLVKICYHCRGQHYFVRKRVLAISSNESQAALLTFPRRGKIDEAGPTLASKKECRIPPRLKRMGHPAAGSVSKSDLIYSVQ